jgi:hypothetical protein
LIKYGFLDSQKLELEGLAKVIVIPFLHYKDEDNGGLKDLILSASIRNTDEGRE